MTTSAIPKGATMMATKLAAPHGGNGGISGKALQTVALLVALFFQFGILIWGASQIKSSVESLTTTMADVRQDLRTIREEIVIGKVERARLEQNQKRIEDAVERIR